MMAINEEFTPDEAEIEKGDMKSVGDEKKSACRG